MQNWNSFFFLNHRLSFLLPCDFVLQYDDDQWPLESTIHQKLLNNAKDNITITVERLFSVQKSFCGHSPKKFKKIENEVADHALLTNQLIFSFE